MSGHGFSKSVKNENKIHQTNKINKKKRNLLLKYNYFK